MAKEVKTKSITKDLIEKIIKVIEIFLAPITAATMVFDFDSSVYVAAIGGAVISVLRCVQVFLKK